MDENLTDKYKCSVSCCNITELAGRINEYRKPLSNYPHRFQRGNTRHSITVSQLTAATTGRFWSWLPVNPFRVVRPLTCSCSAGLSTLISCFRACSCLSLLAS